uniref:Fibrinogen C-terminal domain-containing protein n=1 Tax=Anopheles culicifacies TaxID=139723 RepID=A0A182MVG8_9DIPT
MQFVYGIALAVFCIVITELQATTTRTGFGLEFLQTQLELFELRMQTKLDALQNNIKHNQIAIEYLKNVSSRTFTNNDSGVYYVNLTPSQNTSFEVFRDGSNNHGFGSNWTIFQRRIDGTVNFNRNWTEYKHGFGDVRGEHWLGLEKLHKILNTERHELLIIMEDYDGVIAYAKYDNFQIGNEAQSNLNGVYLNGGKQNSNKGIHWFHFRGYHYSLKATKMMVRPFALRSKG